MISRQNFVRFAQVVLVTAGVVLIVSHPSFFPVYYKPLYMGLVAFAYCFIIELPVLVFRIPKGSPAPGVREKLFVRTRLQAALSLGFLLGGLGSLGLWGLYQVGIPYDKIVHVTFSALVMVSGVSVLQSWYGWSLNKSAMVLALVISLSGVVWECAEFISDRWLHFGYFGRLFDCDSLLDIASNVVGIIAGAVIITRRHRPWN